MRLMKKFCLFMIMSLCLILSACGRVEKTDNAGEEAQQGGTIVDAMPTYFETDGCINEFFAKYNAIAEVAIPTEKIERGNIRTKALVYIDDLSLEVINASDVLSVSMSSSVENEDTTLYAIFRDTIKAMTVDIADEDIQSAWSAIHESGYLVEGYDFNGVSITYVPSTELSWGSSALRVDLEFPLE